MGRVTQILLWISVALVVVWPALFLIVLLVWGYIILPIILLRLLYLWWRLLVDGPSALGQPHELP